MTPRGEGQLKVLNDVPGDSIGEGPWLTMVDGPWRSPGAGPGPQVMDDNG